MSAKTITIIVIRVMMLRIGMGSVALMLTVFVQPFVDPNLTYTWSFLNEAAWLIIAVGIFVAAPKLARLVLGGRDNDRTDIPQLSERGLLGILLVGIGVHLAITGCAALSSWLNFFANGNQSMGVDGPPGLGTSIYDVTEHIVQMMLGGGVAAIGWRKLAAIQPQTSSEQD